MITSFASIGDQFRRGKTPQLLDSVPGTFESLNHDHSLEYAKAVLKRLEDAVKAAKKNGTSIKFEVEKALSEIREVLLRGDKYRY